MRGAPSYGFSALLAPLQQDLGFDRVLLAGAFSFGLVGMAQERLRSA